MKNLMREFKEGQLQVYVLDSEDRMGYFDAKLITDKIKELQKVKEEINIVFAPAVSHLKVFEYLFTFEGVQWEKVNGFHLDEYLGLESNDERKITNFAMRNIFSKAQFKNLYLMDSKRDPKEVIQEYTETLKKHPLDIGVIGIGTNGHLAYNEPNNANFEDPEVLKIVDIDEISIKQASMYDKVFASASDVAGTKAFTMTIPTILKATYLFVACPNEHKQRAIFDTLKGPISPTCPASILRKHPNAVLILDDKSSKLI